MFKFILIAVLVIYGIYRITSFMSRVASTGQENRNSGGGNIHIDKNPQADKKPYRGGDYVDYEEVK